MSTQRPDTRGRARWPRLVSFHLVPWLIAIVVAACTPQTTSAPRASPMAAAASSPIPQEGIFQAPPRASVIQGQQITPIAWVHANVLDPARMDITVLFLYEWQATPGAQVKMDTITLPIDANGNFSGAYADIQQISGYAIYGQTRVSATIDNQKGKPSDTLTSVDLAPASPPSAPAVGTYPLVGVEPALARQAIYTNFWSVGLNVVTAGGKPAAQLRYDGPQGSFGSGPITIDPTTKTFRGKATLKGSSASVSFAGTFLYVKDGASPTGTANYPIITQAFESDTSGYTLTDSVGTQSILWLESSTTTRSGVAVGSAHFSTAPSALAQVLKLRQLRNVLSASISGQTVGTTAPPDDPYFRPAGHRGQYPYPTMNGQLCCTSGAPPVLAADAWGVAGAGGTGIQVAVMDTGVMSGHEDLGGKVLGGHNSLPWPWWQDWLRMWIPGNWRTDTTDLHGHGTGVTGVITANRNNHIGVAGTVADARVIPVRVLDQYNRGSDEALADGLAWLLDNDLADIFNTSLINPVHDPNVAELSRRAVNQGRLFFAGSGNSGQPVLPAPAGFPDVVSVASSEQNDDIADYSGRGINLDIAAPGGNDGQEVTVLWKTGARSCDTHVWDGNPEYCLKFGTSFASPYAAAVGAMLLSAQPNLRRTSVACTANPRECVAQATSILQSTGLPMATPVGWPPYVSHLNVIQARTALVPGAIVITPPTAASALNTPGCNSLAACTAPGLLVRWTAAPPPPAGLALQGYLVYRNGELQLQPPTPNPIIVVGTQYYDTQLPQMPGGAGLVAGRYTYTVTALYQNAATVKRESLSAPALMVDCTAAACL